MKTTKILTLIAVLAVAGNACTDLAISNLNDPDRERALQTGGDVESLIVGAFTNWWSVYHGLYPACAFSVAADAHSSSWDNWGMLQAGEEPRQPFNNDPAYKHALVAERPWTKSYAALAAVRDGLAAIEDGVKITEGDVDVTLRAVAFGKFIQALALTNLALVFNQAFVVDENTDLEAMEMVPAEEVWAAALVKYEEAIQVAQSSDFVIPAPWVGFYREWTGDDLMGFAKAYRARHRTMMPRNQDDRVNLDWPAVLSDLQDGLPFDYYMHWNGSNDSWGYHQSKVYCGGFNSGWARTDYRTIGPADVSGAWETWINAEPTDKQPFEIVTPDSRITLPMEPRTDGKYVRYYGNSPFPLVRGIYHYSHYLDYRFDYFSTGFVGDYPDFVEKEVDFIRAEAWYRTGQMDKAREIVNGYRANGDLPPFVGTSNPDEPDMCVPQMPDSSCGDLWEALKYEKRIEVYHYGFAQEFFDDRGWGDLVEGTFLELPVPGSELLLILGDIYTFGGVAGNGAPGGGVTPDFINNIGPTALRVKRQALEAWREHNMEKLRPVVHR